MINIYGKGGHARMIASVLNESFTFYDDDDYKMANPNHLWIIAIGDNLNREKVAKRLNGFKFVTVYDSSAYIGKQHTIGSGVFISPGVVIQNDVTIGDHSIINTSASVDHDCEIGSYVHIGPNSTLCGAVVIGDGTFIGAGSTIIPGIKIGKNCIIGAGSVVVRDIPDGSKAYGNPCKIK